VILELMSEGGSITLYGARTPAGWQFSRNVIDQTPMLLDEPSTERGSGMAKSWSAALKLLDRYPWHHFSPTHVHPEFRRLAFDAVMTRYKAENREDNWVLPKWRCVCGVGEG
jgi:hypothetical protein